MNFPENQDPDHGDFYAPPNPPTEESVPIAAEVVPDRHGLSISGFLSWLVIGLVSSGIFGMVLSIQLFSEEQVGGDATTMDLMQFQIQAKAQVGQESLNPEAPPVSEMLDTGPYEQRLCFSILLNETEGPEAALRHLSDTDRKVTNEELELTENQKQLRAIVGELFKNYESGNLDSSAIPKQDRDLLEERLGYSGTLALYPSGSPHTAERSGVVAQGSTMMVLGLVFIGLGVLVGGLGFVLAIVLGVMFFTGKLHSKFKNHSTNHNIYAETFAIWITLFFLSSIALQVLLRNNESIMMMVQPGIFFGSLLALFWPLARGVSFAQLKQDIGWTVGNPIKEFGCGVWVYLSTLPFLAPALLLLVIIAAIIAGASEASEFARQPGPGHPIQKDLMSGNMLVIGMVFFATCVAAPIVEETMFRGVLYRHLRDLTSGWKFWISIGFAGLLNSVIFASIHPQGIMAIPILTSLAIGFTVARQWRDSLFSSMSMHAIHNFLITCVSVAIL